MDIQLSSEQVWSELEKELFAVLGMVTAKKEARTVGIVYIIHNRRFYISSEKDAWKVRHIESNPYVSITVPIGKRIPIMPWIKIPAATITFSGKGSVHKPEEVGQEILHKLLRGLETDSEELANMRIIEIEPKDDFVTYGVGVSLMTMRNPDKARGRVSVS